MSEKDDIGEIGQEIYVPQVYYADDLPGEILSMISPLREGEYTFELARRSDILDNLGLVLFKRNIDPDALKKHLRDRVERDRAKFRALIETFPLEAACVVQIGNNPVHVFSYRKTSQKDFVRIAEALSNITSRTPKGSTMPKNIILLPDAKSEVGSSVNGETHTELATLFLYSRAFAEVEHRIPGVSNLEGTVAHEWAHQFISGGFHQLFEDWSRLGKWKQIEWGKYQSATPEQCINDYAKSSPHEDFCESTAAVILQPEYLKGISPRKFEFLQSFLELRQASPQERTPYKILQLDKTKTPEFPTHFRYTLVAKAA